MLIDSKKMFRKYHSEIISKPVEQAVTACGIIIHNNKVLAVQRAGNEPDSPAKWVLPGGKKEKFENIQSQYR